MRQQTTIYVCDINKIITLKPGDRYTLLLWKVIDIRSGNKIRGDLIHHSRRSFPEAVNHYYFTSPKAAAKYFGTTYRADLPTVEEFYERRDILLNELGLKYDSWWEAQRFDYVTALTLRPIKPYEFQNKVVFNHEEKSHVIEIPFDFEKKRSGTINV